MTLIKLGEASIITSSHLHSEDMVFADPDILNRFQKMATSLKSIAPKANDFIYFSAIQMHSAEAALLDENGKIKKDANGKEIEAHWDKKGDSWKWVCSDPSIMPYKNANCDIFPEEELIKAHKKWIGRPLCLDHKSSSVDMIRGVILDTYYDRPNKRIISLCALDKKNYPDLARKVETGYAISVSMGTAVGKAICSDCGNVARVESDFCHHMKSRTCYGEINTDLNPIELSIVVNGADPKAKIRHIVAAANNIAKYVEMKEKELSKLADDESQDIAKAESIETGLDEIIKKLEQLKQEAKSLGDHEKQEQEMQHQASSNIDAIKIAETKKADDQQELNNVYSELENLTNKVNKLSTMYNEGKHMANYKEAYFQGGGDVNEPTPKKPKYEKEDEDSIREKSDKQMLGQMDTGPVDGMHPGYDSFGESEEARKKRLQRMASEKEARQLRRQAALEKAKEAYFQGAGGANEPTPGKPQYEKEDEDSIRDKEDKQMVGQKPFPDVGAVDGLHPSPESADVKDELKRKQLIQRAKLTAKFLEASGSDDATNRAESRWQVYADKKLILSASVKDISGGRVEALYPGIHTEEFGKSLLSKIRSEGVDKVREGLTKTAQPVPAVAAPAASAPADMGAPAAVPVSEPAIDKGGSGDPKEGLQENIDEVRNVMTEIEKGVEVLTNEPGNKLEDFEGMGGDSAVPPATASLINMQKKLGKALLIGMKQASSDLKKHLDELNMAKYIYDNGHKIKQSDTAQLNEIVKDACDETKSTISDCHNLMHSFVQYAEGTDLLVKHAAKQISMVKDAQALPGDPLAPLDDTRLTDWQRKSKQAPAKPAPAKPVAPKPLDPKLDPKNKVMPTPYPGHEKVESWLLNSTQAPSTATPAQKADDGGMVDDCAADDSNDVVEMKPDGSITGSTQSDVDMMTKSKKEAKFDLTTKEGRTMYREKLAEKGLAFSDMLTKAHGKGGFTTQLDMKPEGDLGKVETLEEAHKAFMDVALRPSKGVQKLAEDIQKMVVAGRIDPEKDFPGLIATGLDKEAVSYWKQFWGNAGKEGSQFATELTKERAAKKAAEEKETYQVKVSRAYEVAYDMVRRGMIGDDRHAVGQQVDELMKFNDEAFGSFKRWVEKQPMTVKTASIPQVGMIGGGDIYLPAPEAANSDIASDLSQLFSGRKY